MENPQAETIKVVKELSGISCSMEMPRYSLVSRKLLKIYSEKKKSSSQNSDAIYIPGSVFVDHSCTSPEDMENIELVLWLQDCAKKVADQEFNRARRLLKICGRDASQTGNPMQRIVYYFVEALKEKIDREIGLILPRREYEKPMDAEKVLTRQLHAMFSLKNKLPVSSITHLIGIQSVLDNVTSAKKIHLIDLGIKSGSHFTVLLQSLAVWKECAVELLKITVVGTSRARLEWIGKQLLSFAQNMKVPFQFSFKVIESDMKDLKEEHFGLENGEVVAVYCSLRLWSMLAFPGHIEVLLGVINKLNP
ncbi:hypothetical protein LIER_31877 [Lithospermum erythrorhizon]|uniref:Uncharacterized protein n=1 Tax=Lithospermum erythrorhizon TaxID=34254 RepID=A0AAV3RUF8_LITER